MNTVQQYWKAISATVSAALSGGLVTIPDNDTLPSWAKILIVIGATGLGTVLGPKNADSNKPAE